MDMHNAEYNSTTKRHVVAVHVVARVCGSQVQRGVPHRVALSGVPPSLLRAPH